MDESLISRNMQPTWCISPSRASLPTLPEDIMHEILLNYDEIPSRIVRSAETLESKYRERFRTLRSLSQTCQALRAQILPLLWKTVEACVDDGSKSWYKSVAKATERKANGLRQSPHLQIYVRTVVISLSRVSETTVLPALAQCLSSLPFLKSLYIIHIKGVPWSLLSETLQGHVFPTVEKITLQRWAYRILRCCVNAKDVTFLGDTTESGEKDAAIEMVRSLEKGGCQNLQRLSIFYLDEKTAKRLAQLAKQLSSVLVCDHVPSILALSHITTLACVEIRFPDSAARTKENCIEAAKTVLKQSKHKGQKFIKVWVLVPTGYRSDSYMETVLERLVETVYVD